MFRLFIFFPVFFSQISIAAAQQGNGVVVNVAKSATTIVVRQQGAAVEQTITLTPGDTVRLRNFEKYELFIPTETSVYDLDASSLPGGMTPWHQQFYCVFQDERGSWKLGKGLVKGFRDAARRYVQTTESELREKWDRRLDDTHELRVDPAQLRYCEAFMLEAYLRRKLGLELLIHPDPWSTGQDANDPATISIEALTCEQVPASLKSELEKMVKDALESPFANVQFDSVCTDDDVADAIWDGVRRLAQTSSRTVKPPSRRVSVIENAGGQFSLIGTGKYFGVDGSASIIDDAVGELKKLSEIESRSEFDYLAGAVKPIRDDVKRLAALSVESSDRSEQRRALMHSRINAHYGCSFLYTRNPALENMAVTLDDRPIVDLFTIDETGNVKRSKYFTYQTVRIHTLSNIEISLAGYDYAEYRYKGFCDIIALAANDQARKELEQRFKWESLPIGFDVGNQFQASKRFCVRGVDVGANGQILKRSRVLSFEPKSGHKFVIDGQNLVISPLPLN
ncbi:hypothetical protein [Rubripirellula reticaptiva]|uniref:SLA1 homology domain-containing protein n=1 Tax=Rubripirellula reticaptiva TaxID=2528013 RepID=A0A5C6EPB2_9BACT|nr:hypothetical protein [Rubripirellula reticaptiva]TWU49471.1 hypothetical protein Poly59_40860 [Rubripirellula reticaptiva]